MKKKADELSEKYLFEFWNKIVFAFLPLDSFCARANCNFFRTSVFFFGVNIAGVWNSSSTNERFCYVDLQDFYHIFFQKTCGLTAFKILLSERARGLLAKSCNDIARARSLFARVWDGICESEAYICESVWCYLRECEAYICESVRYYLRECEILFERVRDIFATVWDIICDSVRCYLRQCGILFARVWGVYLRVIVCELIELARDLFLRVYDFICERIWNFWGRFCNSERKLFLSWGLRYWHFYAKLQTKIRSWVFIAVRIIDYMTWSIIRCFNDENRVF